jgi:hypothetical protein
MAMEFAIPSVRIECSRELITPTETQIEIAALGSYEASNSF